MSYPERMVLFLCLLTVVCGGVSAARQVPDSSNLISPDNTLTLGIILVSSEILDCDICGESSLRAEAESSRQ